MVKPMVQCSHGLACDGFQIAKDDLCEIENAQKRDEVVHTLFQNAARIRKAMRINRMLRPIFHKYRRACREILQQKKDEAAQLLILHDYCDSCNNREDSNHDLKLIQSELKEIHRNLASLEELRHLQSDADAHSDSDSDSSSTNSSSSSSSSSSDSSSSDSSDSDQELNEDDDYDDCSGSVSSSSSSSSSSDSSSSSSSGDINDMSDFPI
jgi:hypothetical protein